MQMQAQAAMAAMSSASIGGGGAFGAPPPSASSGQWPAGLTPGAGGPTKVAARPASAPPDWGDAGGYTMGKHPGAAATQYLPPQVRGTIHLKLTSASD